jgi:hypothetical protein
LVEVVGDRDGSVDFDEEAIGLGEASRRYGKREEEGELEVEDEGETGTGAVGEEDVMEAGKGTCRGDEAETSRVDELLDEMDRRGGGIRPVLSILDMLFTFQATVVHTSTRLC